MHLIPQDEPIYLGGYSSGGLLAISMAARRRSLGHPVRNLSFFGSSVLRFSLQKLQVKGVVLLDTFNTQGFIFISLVFDV
jgi:pimeloyl-ACP methyl ester carboxylesterase